MTSRLGYAGVLVCFFLSGFAALLYETAWTREFAFVFGTSDLAVATVLAAYMSGLALGAGVAGRFVSRISRPVLAYALLELGIAAAALAVPWAIDGSTSLLVLGFGGRPDPPAQGGLATTLFYLAASFGILLVPTALMGATLPLLARHAVRSDAEVGRRVGQLYATNTIGAVAGTVTAAFVLLPALGLRHTIFVGVATNAAVFGVAALLARAFPPRPVVSAGPRAGLRRGGDRTRWLLALLFVSGVLSFTYEVLWTRLLGHLLGGSVYAFATMLASFLAGIALGSAVASRFARTREGSLLGFAAAQGVIAACTYAAFASLDRLPALAARLGSTGVSASFGGDVVLAAAMLLPAALGIGATFPLVVRVLARSEADAGPVSARAYAWNTLGAIVGSIAAGFLVIPALGYAGTVRAGMATNLLLALGALGLARPLPRRALVAVAGGFLVLVLAPPTSPWRLLRSSPFYPTPSSGEIAYLAVGRAATVLLLQENGEWELRTNGLPEASIQPRGGRPARFLITAWLGALPLMARPDARSMLVIGLGGGQAVEALPSRYERIDVIELEPEVVEANRVIAAERMLDPLADPRVRVTVNDARGSLLLTERRYDAIVSQPSHPWTAGAAHLYTREFFELAKRRLEPDGVFVQWIALSFLDDALLRSLLATLHAVFADVRVYRPMLPAILFAASDQPLEVEARIPRVVASAPQEWALLGVRVPEDAAAALVLDGAATRTLAAGAPLNTDDHNQLAMRSPRLMHDARARQGLLRLLADSDPLLAKEVPGDRVYLVRRLVAQLMADRAKRLMETTADAAVRETARGFLALALGRSGPARRAFERALESDPASLDARAGWLEAQRAALRAGDPTARSRARELDPAGRAVAEGWLREAARDWPGLRELDDGLGAVAPRHPLQPAAARLRVRWRVEGGDAPRCAEALDVVDRGLGVWVTVPDLIVRARAAACAGFPVAALSNLAEAAQAAPPNSPLAREIVRVLDALSLSGSATSDRARLRKRLAGLSAGS